ncbi:ATP-binding cassette, subfamily B [Tistlia consotensis]|uniref:ATP-binding cassette, subfamily B n=1 Tax=Tistlia consotensis USBA 355 TaxID=560819 RepID=A0A1Y6CJ74_9PROT|nr:ATP-binding cassette domain-containing protein [Tistlia consotensis]SMF57014.1 ATP-binding cassette, subfamily B [Tistlia consotensis USBA 355]SNR45232.1 ATP-binding cassette, subfamily B [Tistlia consotensis]
MPERPESTEDRPAFGWRWIGRTLLLRRRQSIAVAALTGLAYGVGLVFPISIQKAVDAVVGGHAATGPVVGLALLALAAAGLEAAVSFAHQRLLIRLVTFLDRRISRSVFAQLMRVRQDGAGFRSGEMINHFQQATKIRDFVLTQVPRVVFDAGGAVVALGLMLWYDPLIGATLVVLSGVFAWATRGQRGRLRRVKDDYYAAIGERQNVLSETVGGMATVKSLALEGHRMGRWEAATARMLDQLGAVMALGRTFQLRAQLTSRLLTLLVVGLCLWRLFSGDLTVGEMLALQLLAARVTRPILALGDLYRGYQEADVAISRIGAFLAEPREQAAVRPALRRLGPGGIALSEVSLTYPGAARPALDRVTARLPEQGVVAIVGRNGSGKSSLLRILLGLRRDYEGRVEIGGADLRDYDPRWLRSRIGVVDQDTVLFSGTVRENLCVGRPAGDATLRRALRFAGALELVEALPGGLDAALSEGGRSLSGGQRQRLSVARAVVRDPCIALLDEPTAFLDAEAAVELERRLADWGRERLLILVTHHLAAARHAERILVLDEGRLVGDGRHDDLAAAVPAYATLWRDYLRSLDSEPPHAEAAE